MPPVLLELASVVDAFVVVAFVVVDAVVDDAVVMLAPDDDVAPPAPPVPAKRKRD